MRFFVLLISLFTLIACQKEALQLQTDITAIQTYLTDNNLSAEQDAQANFFYRFITQSGSTTHPQRDANLEVIVDYKMSLLDGTVLENTNGQVDTIALDGSIYGWQLALPLMAIDDKMQLFLPSRLGYGETGWNNVPANAVLIFEIELKDIIPRF